MNLIKREYVDPVKDFGSLLLDVDKPSRYTGGGVGSLAGTPEKKEAVFQTLIAFPDLYEIGMGNQALRIIYNALNAVKDISCDFCFAPAPDFEKLLREKRLPLYGIDSGITLGSLDLLMFTIGYELSLGGALLMLDVSGIPLQCSQRKDSCYPLIIAGGPAVSNPLAFSPFIDAFWIGEAEAGFFELMENLAQMKKDGKGREEMLSKISSHPNVWVKGKDKTLRAIYSLFSSDERETAVFPVPGMKIVQNHGTVEIMRGCPNGCRFCHAGFWYRPMRQKSAKKIISEVEELTQKGGWQEISLSSLSSGDYNGIDSLVQKLNNRFSHSHVSFQLPSLKVSGFSLELLQKISLTRKSGLTFAVETPCLSWQMAINKQVTMDSVVSILEEAKKNGWKSAKFYFLIGLPLPLSEAQKSEEEEIVNFIVYIARKTKMRFNINVGLFIPKPHTPYQRASQMDHDTAERKLEFIRNRLKPLGHKVSISDTLISRIEGLLSRGDERAGLLFLQAYNGGSRLDAWNEFIDREVWERLFNENKELIDCFLQGKENPVWQAIDCGVSEDYFANEFNLSEKSISTPSCKEKCSLCGVCGKEIKVTKNSEIEVSANGNSGILVNHKEVQVNKNEAVNKADPAVYRILFSFSKKDSAVFHGHLSLIEIFSMSLRRAGIPVIYTKGFNPITKMEFASPLSTGISAGNEIASVDFADEINTESFLNKLNDNLPQGIVINKACGFFIKSGMKKHSLASLLWGFSYKNNDTLDYVPSCEEKNYRKKRFENDCKSRLDLIRHEVLARNITDDPQKWACYFDVYKALY
jgi:radical SAM superfamily enzyme YgiQ (UPF0313 family)